jgi:hypothetical protein
VRWIEAFLFTQIAELPVWLAAHRLGPRLDGAPERPSLRRAVLLAVLASALTHPVVWFVFPELRRWLAYWPMVACAELFAVGVEAGLARASGIRHALAWSVAANAVSFALGVLILWPIWRSR